ncbi:ABC-type multidrug transport system, ATPase and permease component [Actinobacteria bacterium IMCC26256]|nr:ABC-type multidrug transport system, ATPase and permease component [Actinobacteria bacterium IMCC26256]
MRGGWVESGPLDDESRIDRAAAGRVVLRLGRMLRPQRSAILRAVFLLIFQTAALLASPLVVRYAVDAGLVGKSGRAINIAAVMYLVLAVTSALLGRSVIWAVSRIGEDFLRSLRARVFRHLINLDLGFFEREKTGRLVARMTSDIDALQELVSQGLVMFVQNALIFVGTLVVMSLLSWQLTLCTIIVVPPVIFASLWFRKRSNTAYLEVRDRVGTNLSTLQEGLEGVRVVQAFGREGGFIERFEETNEAQYDANIATVNIATRYFPFVEFIGVVGLAVVVGAGSYFADRNILEVGTVLAFVLYLNNLFEPIQQLSQLYNTVQSAAAALNKLFGLLDTPNSVPEKPGAIDLPLAGALTVSGVTFAYGGGPPDTDGVSHPLGPIVLADVNITVAAGERVALVGPTGAGKSTLAKLMARFYDPIEGDVSFGGVSLRDATRRSLRERIAVVPQEGFLFAGTVRDNIRVGSPEASDADVDAAVDALGLREHFESFPEGLDTEVRERGSRLSAGEKQLVSLARAALADPTVLVLDEATSNLDPGTELEVERALEALTQGRTVIVVAHRLSTAQRCDRVAVVADGHILEIGTHDDLVSRGDAYAALFAAWTRTE